MTLEREKSERIESPAGNKRYRSWLAFVAIETL